MTPQEARQIANDETAAYNALLIAGTCWTDRFDETQATEFELARIKWQSAKVALHIATWDNPHLFSPFSAAL